MAVTISLSTAYLLLLDYFITSRITEVFNRNICRVSLDCSTNIIYPLFWNLQTLGEAVSLISILIVINLVRKEGTAFTLQLLQIISVCVHTFFFLGFD